MCSYLESTSNIQYSLIVFYPLLIPTLSWHYLRSTILEKVQRKIQYKYVIMAFKQITMDFYACIYKLINMYSLRQALWDWCGLLFMSHSLRRR